MYLLGIDIGTTNLKAVAFDMTGEEVAISTTPTPIKTYFENVNALDALEVWNTVSDLISNIVQKVGNDIHGIAVTGMAESGLFIDRDGAPLTPAIIWYDRCTDYIADRWKNDFGEDKIMKTTGQRIQFNYSANKMMYLLDRLPGISEKIYKWHCMPDYISFMLTGRSVMDYSIAGRTMIFNPYSNSWSKEICDFIGIGEDVLPDLIPCGEHIGNVKKSIAEKIGIKSSTNVYAGGHDHPCGAFASGIIKPGDFLDSSGTAEMYLTISDSESCRSLSEKGFNFGSYVIGNSLYVSGAIPSSGKSVDWFSKTFNVDREHMLDSAEADGLMFLPFVEGGPSPARNTLLSGGFTGIRSYHTLDNMKQAVYEGICFELKRGINSLSKNIGRIVVTGGGTRNEAWLQTKANILQKELVIPRAYQSTALGAALLAGIGAGVYSNHTEAIDKTFKIERVVTPQQKTEYSEAYDRYCEIADNKVFYSYK